MQAAAIAAALCAACQSEGSAQREARGGTPFRVSEVAKFSTPWAMAFLPGSGLRLTNAALLTEKEGKLWLVDVTNGKRTAVSGVPSVVNAGQGGLGDVMPHPDFAGNQRVYLSYVEGGPNGTSGAALGYGRLDLSNAAAPALRDFKVIWRQQPKVTGDGHFSHRIAFGPDGFLYLTSGDRQKMAPAQDFSGNLGKVLRLTDEGAPAPGNPYASRGGVAAQFWSIGHRNLLGIQFAPDGRLWEAEMGPQGGDEINLILPGRNYGWPRASNGSHYGGGPIPDHKPGDGFEAPKVWWTPSISPGALLIYNGDKFPQWKGDALVGALSGEALIRIDIDGDEARKADNWPMNARTRAIDEGPDGSVYLLQDGESGGRLLRLDPR
ncbi:MAG TPA: PQQ-dependent sugar dehydrogenase [Sphingomicrobium sp.]